MLAMTHERLALSPPFSPCSVHSRPSEALEVRQAAAPPATAAGDPRALAETLSRTQARPDVRPVEV